MQSRLPGFMAAPSLTTANTEDSTAPANGPTQSAQHASGGCVTQPQDAMLSAPEVAVEDVMPISVQEARELPPVTLMSSTADIIVPWSVNNPLESFCCLWSSGSCFEGLQAFA